MEHVQCCIIGAGPAGLSAAIYTARAGMSTHVLGCAPKVAGDYDIDNYFGFEETISGKELVERGRRQAERFGARVVCDKVLSVHHGDTGGFHVKSEGGERHCDTVIMAAGVSRVRPGIKNLDDYDGKGVSYCVSCDGFFYKGKKVMVLGQGVFAANQALELTNYTSDVRVVTQGKELTMTPEYEIKLREAGIPVIHNKVETLSGEGVVEKAHFVQDQGDGDEMAVDGVFVAMGEASSLDFAYSLGLQRKGVFILADLEQRTNIPGVYAAGDCVGRFLQIAVAVGEGARAAKSAIDHIKELERTKA